MFQRNYTIDIFRIIGAFCVVALHSPLGSLPNAAALAIRLGSRWAVPFFFLVSGYFVAQKPQSTTGNRFLDSINNLLSIIVTANILYILFYVLDNNPATTIKLTLVGLLIGQSGHLWFIGSMIFGLLFLQYAVKRYSDTVLLLIAVFTLAGIVACDGYSLLFGTVMQYETARYLTSIPFLFMGFLIARHSAFLTRLPIKTWIGFILLGLLLEVGEAVTLYRLVGASPHNQELLVGAAVVAVSLFCLSLVFVTTTQNVLSDTGKDYSLLIYLYHPIIVAVFFDKIKLGQYSPYIYWISPLIVFAVTLFILVVLKRRIPRAFALISGR